MNLKASRGSLCVRMGACFNAKVTKQNPATLLTVELGFFGVCSQIFFFFSETGFVVFPECGSKALPRERRGSLGLAHRQHSLAGPELPSQSQLLRPRAPSRPLPEPRVPSASAPGALHGARLTAPLRPP